MRRGLVIRCRVLAGLVLGVALIVAVPAAPAAPLRSSTVAEISATAQAGGTEAEIPCEGDACQPLPVPPEDPQPGTLAPGPANPPPHYQKPKEPRPGHKHHHGHRGKK